MGNIVKFPGNEKCAADRIEFGQGDLQSVKNTLQPAVETKRARHKFGNDLTRGWWRKRYGTGKKKTAFSVVDYTDGLRKLKPISIMNQVEKAQAVCDLFMLVSVYLSQIKTILKSTGFQGLGAIGERLDEQVLAALGYKKAATKTLEPLKD
jgi:hypothetical protein